MKTFNTTPVAEPKWWQKGVFYQIYPRSFQDTSGNGIGDLKGILQRLDYVASTGFDAIWISPIFPSPMADFGYDVSDYCDIHPLFGDLKTFDELLAAAHERNLKIILDFVPNHSSDQHPWFIESRSSRDNPKRDWYIWKDAKEDGSFPNNWESEFGGPAWTWDEKTGQYYLHTFLRQQPDLNWRNPEVVEAMHNNLRFWLDRGVDGFRVDAVIFLIKSADFTDNPLSAPGGYWHKLGRNLSPEHTAHSQGTYEQIRLMRRVFDEYEDRVHIGETGGTTDFSQLIPYYGNPLDGYDIPFNFSLLHADWDIVQIRSLIEEYYEVIPEGSSPNFVMGNHDVHRIATRYGYENHRSVAMLLLTLWGIPTIYNGDELGMEDVFIPVADRIDPWGINKPDSDFGRDPERTPMQWDASPNAGFTTSKPWLPLADNYKQRNVAVESAEPHSTLNFYKTLLHLRRELPALHSGSFTFVDGLAKDVLAYIREADGKRLFVAINFSADAKEINISQIASNSKTLLATNFEIHAGTTINLPAHQSVLLEILPR
ncbi:MAG TPA: alpha-amylase family glycosyl hydrolase [Anaerolineales bacterium]|nr:alpha-amylase family glycosyl hydrolase [Anaerolineales bacterium]